MKNHFLGKTSTYLRLIAVSVVILMMTVLVITILDKMDMGQNVNDGIAEGIIFFVCIPGILIGAIGAIICAIRKK